MTTISSTQRPAVVTTGGTAPALAVTGAVLAANGLLLGSQLFFDSRDYSEVAGGPVHLLHYVIWTAGMLALSQLYHGLGRVPGRSGRTIPAAVVTLASVGVALDACARFVSAFVTPYLAAQEPALVDSTPDTILLVPLLATGVVAMAGTAALAVSAWRRGVFPRPAAVLLVVGAVAIPALGPLSNVLLGAALVWIGLALRGSRSA